LPETKQATGRKYQNQNKKTAQILYQPYLQFKYFGKMRGPMLQGHICQCHQNWNSALTVNVPQLAGTKSSNDSRPFSLQNNEEE